MTAPMVKRASPKEEARELGRLPSPTTRYRFASETVILHLGFQCKAGQRGELSRSRVSEPPKDLAPI